MACSARSSRTSARSRGASSYSGDCAPRASTAADAGLRWRGRHGGMNLGTFQAASRGGYRFFRESCTSRSPLHFAGQIARLSQPLGIYPALCRAYHNVSPPIRRERAERTAFHRELVVDGSLCFDIGANVGQTIESLLGCGASVDALEPNPSCQPVLEWQFGRDERVKLVSEAVGSQSGHLTLHKARTDSRASIR